MRQMSIFDLDCEKPYKIKKPVRLIELFGGIGSQAKALENLNVNFEHYRLCEFDKYAVQSYNAVHGTNFKTSDITKIKAADLGITEIDKYEYIMTYSFPCQDLSIAGKQSGMAKGSGTRSGLLWEVERLLKECKELPQVLLMENVPQVLNCDFGGWLDFLYSLGYKNYYKILNAKNFGIPQNRERCFMVSVLGKYYYDFPKEIPLKLRLKDMLESNVDEKYYIKNAKVNTLLKGLDYENANKVYCDMTINQPRFRDIANTIKARYDCGIENQRQTGTAVIEPKCEVVATLDIPGRFESACRVHGIDGIAPACNTCGGGGLETKIAEPIILQQPHGFNKGAELERCPSITTSCWESNNFLKEPIIYDDYNQHVKADQTAINTLTTNCGSTAERSGVKIIEPIIVDDLYNNREPRKYGDTVPTLRVGGGRLKNECENGDTINAFNKTVDKTGISPIVNYRVRKLTPKECWRLMGFTDSDFDKAKASGVSDSQLYKQAGNSIVVPVLEAIFRNLF